MDDRSAGLTTPTMNTPRSDLSCYLLGLPTGTVIPWWEWQDPPDPMREIRRRASKPGPLGLVWRNILGLVEAGRIEEAAAEIDSRLQAEWEWHLRRV